METAEAAVAQKRRFYYGWAIVAVALLVNFFEVGIFNPVLAVFMKPMAEEFGWSRGMISFAVSIGAFSGGFTSTLVGPFLDRRGTRMVMSIGLLLLGGIIVGLSRIAELWQFYLLFGLGRILSLAAVDLSVMVVISNWFVKKRGRAMATALTGTRLGMAALPAAAQFLILAWNWRTAWVVLGIALLVATVVPAALVVRRRPEDLGLLPDGSPAGLPSTTEADEVNTISPPKPEAAWTLRQAVRTPTLWLITAAVSQVFMASGALNLHQMPYLTDVGIPPAIAVGAVSLWALSGAAGGMLWGFVAERVHVRYCMVMIFLSGAIGIVMLMMVRSPAMAYAYALWYGVAFGGMITLTTLVWADYFGRPSVGAIRGVTTPFQMTANAAGPLFAGWMFDVTGSYQIAFTVFAALYFVAALWVLLARPLKLPAAAVS